MELRHLEYVVAVVDAGGFTKAAAAAHVAQPSLSQGVRALEEELGTPLFHRLGRRVVLTPAGEAIVGPARRALREAAVARAAVAEVRGMRAGHLDLVALPTLAADPLAGLVGRFRSAHPEVSVRVREPETVGALVAMVADGSCEVGLAVLPVDDDALVAVPLRVQELVAIWPPGTEVPASRTVSIQRLVDVALVATPQGTSTRQLLDEALAAAGHSPRIAVETGQREMILPLVLAGAGVALMPESTAAEAERRGAVVTRLRPAVRRTIGLVYRPGPHAPAAQRFIALAT